MPLDAAVRGSLFPEDFLTASVDELPEWSAFDAAALDDFTAAACDVLARFPTRGTPNESETEDDLIWPILSHLGWTASLRQQKLSRADVPDGLLFTDAAAKTRAVGLAEGPARYAIGAALVESKRWRRPLDRASGRSGEALAPSTQMLRYLRRADDLTDGGLRWGMLTNGAQWRLYYQGARSVAEQFFEIDLPAALGLPGPDDAPLPLSEADRRRACRLFAVFFGRAAFLPDPADGRTLHQRAIQGARYFEERVAANLSKLVFEQVFPDLTRALAAAAPDAALPAVRDAALVLLYRLLFILYAEDRGLLPVHDARYAKVGLRRGVREDVGRRKDRGETFSDTAARYWNALADLCRVIDRGDPAFGLPPYNGGLFDEARTPLLARVRLSNRVMADVIDALSFERPSGPAAQAERRYINYRSLSVQQLGSIYERLLEYETVREDGDIVVRPNVFARKGSGSYYTPDTLVGLILDETVGPLAQRKLDAFRIAVTAYDSNRDPRALAAADPAEALLDLKICDPAMGSGHFLVSLVDLLSDRVIAAIAEADAAVEGYVSPLTRRIADIRRTILDNAAANGWTVDAAQLDDRHVIRRMVLKRCIYGVDKNPMAVELAKVSLWLHTFTVGAPLSFLDHHLRRGDSLFGCWARQGIERTSAQGHGLFIHEPVNRAADAAGAMQTIERLTDAEIAEAHRSAQTFAEVEALTAPLDAFLSVLHAFDWLDVKTREDKAALHAFFEGRLGDPIALAQGTATVAEDTSDGARFAGLLARARGLIADERFLNWQAAFPGVWTDLKSPAPTGGFDAVIGNPPWDRVKLQQVEWFAARRRDVALTQRAADRKRMIAVLEQAADPLAADFQHANARAAATARMARTCGDYPLLSRGDVNLYSLFVERAMSLVKPDGVIGLLVPSGIASDKTAAPFFRSVATEGRLRALYDFENKKVFFPDVHASFKFCIFVAGRQAGADPARCAFYIHELSELENEDRRFPLAGHDFARVNPNTGTAPIFRTRRDAELTTAIYARLPVLVDRSSGQEVRTWPVRYSTMFHMANDSNLFRTREELENREGAWEIGGNRFDNPQGTWVPLYEGKMVQAFDHRAADVTINEKNLFKPGQQESVGIAEKRNPDRLPIPRYHVRHDPERWRWADDVPDRAGLACRIAANLNTAVFDFVARQKVPTTHFAWYVLEQLPVVPPDRFEAVRFGPKTAADLVREAVLELTYTAHDMAPFARDLGHIDEAGVVRPPFPWDEDRRLHLRAKLDAVFFHLYGVTDRADVRYVYSTFPIVERQETATYGRYRSRDLCLAWLNALSAGRPDAQVEG